MGGSQEVKKHKELLGREARTGEAGWDAADLTLSPALPHRTQWGPGLTIAWILVGPGLCGADSMSWARCREP